MTGLVLEGGAMRGLFTAGVLDVWMEAGLRFDAAVGVSAGAAFGCNLKSRQIGRVLRYNLKYCRDPRYCSLRSLLRTGDLFGAEFCYRTLPKELDPFDGTAYERDPMPFYVVCTDVETGAPVYHRCDRADDETFEWFRASASMPLASRPVRIGGRTLLDGGVSDAIPLAFLMEQGCERNVVVLTQPREYEKKKSGVYRLLRKYPRLAAVMKRRHLSYNEARSLVFARERRGSAFVLCPDETLEIGRVEHDPEKIRAVYEQGRKVAVRRLSDLMIFLQTDAAEAGSTE